MGVSSAEIKQADDALKVAAGELPAAPEASETDVLKAKVASLEATVKRLEEEVVQAVKNDINSIATFLKSKYPYSL